MQWLANVSVRRPVFAAVLVLGICVLGYAGYKQLGVDRFPKIDAPFVSVVTRLPGAAPEDVETEVTHELEESLNTISGIDELRSVSSEGVSMVFVSFKLDKDVDVAAQEVRDRVNLAMPRLPRGVELPTITRVDPSATPALYVAVNGKLPLREITEVADRTVRQQIENVNGVGEVVLLGGRKRQVNVWIDPLKLRAYGLTAFEVQRAIAAQNLSLPAGSLQVGQAQHTLRLRGRVATPEELASLVVKNGKGRPVRVGDVARIEDGQEEGETLAVRNGERGVVLAVRKQADANTVAVVDAVRERLGEIALPPGVTLEVARDNSETIRTSVHAVKEHLVLGALFAALTVLLFLGHLRSTVIAALAIPISLVGTFALMWLQGFTLDTITLLALALAVGIVIDDAIVVLENVYRYVVEKEMAPREAAIQATREIGLAVLATTVSLLAVFLPVAFMGGIVGRFLKSFGLTMAYAIAISLFVSFTLTPMLASKWLKAARPIAEGAARRKPILERPVDRFYQPIERAYMALLGWVMRRRWVVVAASVLALAASAPLMGAVKKGFLPDGDEAHFEINLRAAEGTGLEATGIIAERIAREVRRLPGVVFTLTTIGDNTQRAPNQGIVYVKLTDPEQRAESQVQIMERVRKEILAHKPADLQADVSLVPIFSGGMAQAMVMYDLTGPELRQLEESAAKILEGMKKIPGAVDVSSTMVSGKPEVAVYVDRDKAADLGVSVADVAATLQLLVAGAKVSTFEQAGQQFEIRARAERAFRADAEGLRLVTVPSARLGAVPLADVVELRAGKGPAQINRLNRRRQVSFLANVSPGVSEATVVAGVEKVIAEVKLPAGYRAQPMGRSKEMAKAGRSFLLAFVLAIVFMYLALAAQFESWLHPVTILLALPLTLPFALVSLLLLGQSLNIFSALGILVLFAVIKKNAILQIDHTNQLRAEGVPRLEAILRANKDRLRPILMTTLAFVAGMVPLVMSSGIGAGYNQATAGVVVGGQVLSLLLTLVATPVAYSLFDDAGAWVRRLLGRGRAPVAVGAATDAA